MDNLHYRALMGQGLTAPSVAHDMVALQKIQEASLKSRPSSRFQLRSAVTASMSLAMAVSYTHLTLPTTPYV